VVLHYGKKRLFWSLIIFSYLCFTMVRGKKIGFNSCECIKFFNIANIHAFHIWRKRIKCCNDITFFLYFFCFYNVTFFHRSYVIKPLQPSCTICRAPPFTGHLFLSLNRCETQDYQKLSNFRIHFFYRSVIYHILQ